MEIVERYESNVGGIRQNIIRSEKRVNLWLENAEFCKKKCLCEIQWVSGRQSVLTCFYAVFLVNCARRTQFL